MKQKHYLTFLLFILFCTFCGVALGHDFEAVNDETPDTEELVDWESTNHDHSTTDSYTYEFTVDEMSKLTLDWYVSSESNYDFLTITLDGNTIVRSSGEDSGTSQAYVEAGTHTLIVSYTKDSSASYGNDNAGIRNIQLVPDDPLADNTAAVAGANKDNPIETQFVVNGTFDSNIRGWNRTGWYVNNQLANNQQGDFTGYFWENWHDSPHANKMYQVVNYIPNGTYKLKIAAFVNTFSQPNQSQYVFANDDKTYLTTGAPTFYEVYTYVTGNSIEVGLEQTLGIANWMGIDNVTLTYYGPDDVVDEVSADIDKTAWEEALSTAQQVLTDYATLVDPAKDNLEAVISNSIAEPTTHAGYQEALNALRNATAAFLAVARTYTSNKAELDDEIAYAESLGVDATAAKAVLNAATSTAADYQTATENLRVAEYNTFVGEGTEYTHDVTATLLGDMTYKTSNVTANWGQHWDGSSNSQYWEQSGDNWAQNSWSLSFSYTPTLPAGDYVIYAAGRGSTNVQASMSVAGQTANFICKGDVGYGIDTSGKANYSSDGTYANNGLGRGFQYRYIPFTVNEQGEVTIIFDASANEINKWVSITTITLLTKQSTELVQDLEDWESTNHEDGTRDSHTYHISVEEASKLSFDWYVSSEQSYDFLTITLDGNTIIESSGENNGSHEGDLTAGTHTLIVSYTKDGSVSNGNDYAGIRNIIIKGPDAPILFADAKVKAICVQNWDTNGDGELSYAEAAAVTSIGTLFANYDITSFNELQYFLGLKEIEDNAFSWCENLTSIMFPNSITHIGQNAFNSCGLTEIAFPNSVTTIGSYAFPYCSGLRSVQIPSSVTSIGEGSFAYNSLTSIVVANGNPRYDSRNNCNAIIETETNTIITGCKNTVIPSTVTTIGNLAFYGCGSLTSLEIPNSVTSIGSGAFINTGLTNIDIPNSVTSIGSQAFGGCHNLTSVKLPNTMTSIAAWAFEDCSKLTDVYCLATQVPSAASSTFNATDISSATLHVLSSSLDAYSTTAPWSGFGTIVPIDAFEEGDSALIVMERNYRIEWGNNYSYPDISLRFDNNVSLSVGYYNADYWNGTYNETCKGIHIISNINGTNQKDLFISAALTGQWVKEKLVVSEKGVVQYYMNDQLMDVGVFDQLNLQEAQTVYVDVNPYGWWTGHKQYMDDFVLTTGDLTISDDFNDNSLNTAIWETPVNPDGVREEDGAVKLEQLRTDQDFHLKSKSIILRGRILIEKQRLENWESTNHDHSTTDSHTWEFTTDEGDKLSFDWYVSSESGYDYLTVTLDGNIIVQSSGVDNGSYKMTLTTGNHTLVATYSKDYMESANNDNAGVRNIIITGYYVVPEGNIEFADANVKTICVQNWDTNSDGELSYKEALFVKDLGNAFTGHGEITSFDELQYFLGLSSIGDGAFNSCTQLASIEIPKTVTDIGYEAFRGCTGLTSIEIPHSVNTIGVGAFQGCTGLTSFVIPNSVTYINDYTFANCSGLTSVEIPNSVTSIESNAFAGCTGLTSIEIPSSVTEIEDYAFCQSGLVNITIPNSVTSIGNYAFNGCHNLLNVEIPNSVTYIGDYQFVGSDELSVIHWTPNADIEVSASPITSSSSCVLYLFKEGDNGDKVDVLASQFDGQFKAIYVIEGTLELAAFASEEEGDDYYYCTYYDYEFNLMITDGVAQAFSATYDNSSLTLHAVEEEMVYADYPVIFRTTEPLVSLYIVSNISGTNTAVNDLQGTAEEMTVSRGDRIYVLYNGGFHLTEGTIPAHKAYLDLSSAESAPERLSFGEGEATPIIIADDADKDADGPWYTVSGQRVDQPTKGIFIKNGKKYLFK